MPEHKRIQGPEETRNPLLFLQPEEKSHKPTVSVTPVSNSKQFRPCSVNFIPGRHNLLDVFAYAPGNLYDNGAIHTGVSRRMFFDVIISNMKHVLL